MECSQLRKRRTDIPFPESLNPWININTEDLRLGLDD